MYICNSAVKRIMLGSPVDHKHLRLAMELEDGEIFLLSEATVANIVRAYVNVKTHPQKRAIEMISEELSEVKDGYAPFQLLESERDAEEIEGELAELLETFEK